MWQKQHVASTISAMPSIKDDPALVIQREFGPSTSLPVAKPFPLGGIVGLAAGGIAFAIFLAVIAIYLARRRDRRKRTKLKEVDVGPTEHDALPMRKIRSPSRRSQALSLNPFLPPRRPPAVISNEWLEDESMMDSPPMTKAQARRLSQKGLFQISRIRDSWPLAASMPNVPVRLLQPNSSLVTLNQVGGGGYAVPPDRPQWPGRTYSKKSKTKIVVSAEDSNMQRFSTSEFDITPRRPPHHQRSASVSQLSTILRSTSQRLKAAHRKTLSRTLTTFRGSMGPPPSDKLMTPRRAANESRAGVVKTAGDDAETIASSICDAMEFSPNAERKELGLPSEDSMQRRSSITLSLESIESLYGGVHPNLVNPLPLTSPSRKLTRSPRRHAMCISPADAEDLSAMIHGQSRASTPDVDDQGSTEEKTTTTSPHRISLASDPFYSVVKSGKLAMPQDKIIGPRPFFMRQTTFGHEATPGRPASFASNTSSPLQSISGNVRSISILASSSSPIISASKANPFSWEPEKTVSARIQQSPSRKGSRRKGHKRSRVVRISLPRTQHVPISKHQDDDTSLLEFTIPPKAPARACDPAKSPTRKPPPTSHHRLGTKPPSISHFNPVLAVPKQSERNRHTMSDSPTLGADKVPQSYSPTLATSNYYSEGRTSEDEFFNARTRITSGNSSLNENNPPKNDTTVLAITCPDEKELFSFPPLQLEETPIDRISLPPPLSSMANSVRSPTSPKLLTAPQSLPAPPVLTEPASALSHFHAPPSEPTKRLSDCSLAPTNSILHHSICMLRRMNSEVSRCSLSSDEEEGQSSSPASTRKRECPPKRGHRSERQSRGSKSYLSMGMNDQRKSRISKSLSSRSDSTAKRHVVKISEGQELVDWERKGLETLRESKRQSRRLKVDQIKPEEGFRFPILNSHGGTTDSHVEPNHSDSLTTELVTPTSPSTASPLKSVRWSNATPTPTIRVIRHESWLLQPTAQVSTTWKSDVDKAGADGLEGVKENLANPSPTSPAKESPVNWSSNFGRPDSSGLYDAAGFLRNSAEKEGVHCW